MKPPIRFLIVLLLALIVPSVSAFEPFFDDNPATRHAPEDPALTDLDLDVLILCGEWGSRVAAADFERMMLKPENLEATNRIREALGARVYSGSQDTREFVRQLRRAWFEQKGFEHIFCGEPGVGRDLGGLHYAPRYWQAQERGWAGYRPLARDAGRRPVAKCREPYLRERVDPPIFNISIAFVNPDDPRNNVKCLGGYHREMNAERLLIAATAAFKQANRRVDRDETASCFFETRLAGVESYLSNLVIRRRAIRTFYPLVDKRPYCRRDRRDYTACLCSRI
jgi:hypothetical protein